MYLAHPFRVAAGEVVVDGDDVNALACQGVQIRRQGGDQRFAFARLHFGNAALMQGDAADDLHVIVFELEHAPRRFPDDRKGVVENVVQRFARFQPVFEDLRLLAQLCVRHFAVFGFQRLHAKSHFVQLFHIAAAVAVEQVIDESHECSPSPTERRYKNSLNRGKICFCRILLLFYYILEKM